MVKNLLLTEELSKFSFINSTISFLFNLEEVVDGKILNVQSE